MGVSLYDDEMNPTSFYVYTHSKNVSYIFVYRGGGGEHGHPLFCYIDVMTCVPTLLRALTASRNIYIEHIQKSIAQYSEFLCIS